MSLASTSSAGPAAVGADLDDDADGGMKMDGRQRVALMARLAGQDASAAMPMGINPLTGLPQAMVTLPPPPPRPDASLQFQQGRLGPPSPIPTECILMKNMFDPAQESGDGWDIEIGDDVTEECKKYGTVCHCFVDRASQARAPSAGGSPPSWHPKASPLAAASSPAAASSHCCASPAQGFVYVKFSDVAGASAALRVMNGRWFGNRQVQAVYQFAAVYNQHFEL